MEYWHDKFPIVQDMINILYNYCPTGGCCHIVTDDDNIDDESLDFVINYSQEEENKDSIESELCIAICKILKSMTLSQRIVLFDGIELGIEFTDKESFDRMYEIDEEWIEKILNYYNKNKE